jgi:hypothetical protein
MRQGVEMRASDGEKCGILNMPRGRPEQNDDWMRIGRADPYPKSASSLNSPQHELEREPPGSDAIEWHFLLPFRRIRGTLHQAAE